MREELLASKRHTAGLIGIVLLTAAFGIWFQRQPATGAPASPSRSGVLALYFSAALLDWGVFYYVWMGTRRHGTPFTRVVGGRWAGWKDVARDIAIAIPFWAAWEAAAILMHRLLGPDTAKSIGAFLPRTPPEIAAWIGVSATAGFTEEFVFRGYLQQQLRAWTGRASVALVLQSVCFGIGHAYQGVRNVAVISVLGALYGLLFLWRRSARPGMLAHAWSDVYGGLRMQFLSRLLPF